MVLSLFNKMSSNPLTQKNGMSGGTFGSKSLLFLIKEFGETSNSDESAHIVPLRHPKSGKQSLFLFSPGNEIVQEINTFNEQLRSYFINNEVKSNGKLYMSTPVDPLYLALPYLKNYGRCSPLDHILTDEEFPETERLLTCSGLKYIHHIADKKGDESLNAHIYNEEKTLKWLEKKVRRVAGALKDKGVNVSSRNVISANFLAPSSSAEADEDSYLRYALGIVGEYLPDSVEDALESHLKLKTEKKRKNSVNGTDNTKRKKIDEISVASSIPDFESDTSSSSLPSSKDKDDEDTSIPVSSDSDEFPFFSDSDDVLTVTDSESGDSDTVSELTDEDDSSSDIPPPETEQSPRSPQYLLSVIPRMKSGEDSKFLFNPTMNVDEYKSFGDYTNHTRLAHEILKREVPDRNFSILWDNARYYLSYQNFTQKKWNAMKHFIKRTFLEVAKKNNDVVSVMRIIIHQLPSLLIVAGMYGDQKVVRMKKRKRQCTLFMKNCGR